MNFFWGAILGAALTLGLFLAGLIRPGRQPAEGRKPTLWPLGWAVLLGTLFFGTAHLIHAWLVGTSPGAAPLIPVMGFVAGAGLSVALSVQLQAGRSSNWGRWLLCLGASVLTFVLIQWAFIATESRWGSSLWIVWPGRTYRADFTRYGVGWVAELMERYPRWPDYLALLDAALVAIVLGVGVMVGVHLAARWWARWRHLSDR